MLSMLASVVLLLLLPTLLAYIGVAIAAMARPNHGSACIPMDERAGALVGLLIVAMCLWIGG